MKELLTAMFKITLVLVIALSVVYIVKGNYEECREQTQANYCWRLLTR